MNIKRFVAPDMRQAIRRVREEHGPDAVILKSQRGPDGVEVLSATDFDEKAIEAAAHHPSPARSRAQRSAQAGGRAAPPPQEKPAGAATVNQRPRPAAAPAPKQAPPAKAKPTAAAAPPKRSKKPATPPVQPARSDSGGSQMQAVTRELRSLRGLLQTELASLAHASLSHKDPVRAEVVRKLTHLGVDDGLARRLTERLQNTKDPREAWRESLMLLARQIPRVEHDLLRRGGRIAFYGPAGVGKTTTITKLAMLFARRHGRQSVGLIGADAQRPGAQREMLALGQDLGVYTLAASTPAEIREALEVLADRRLVLIDTVSMGQRDPRLATERNMMATLPVEPWLVIAANIQQAALGDIIRHYTSLKPRGCVLTKIDECAALGDSLSAVIARGLPLGFVSCGPRVPEDLTAARPDWLMKKMVGMAKERQQASRRKTARSGRKRSEVAYG